MSLISNTVKWVVEPPFFGLDISDLTLKFLKVGSSKAGPKIDYFGEIEIPSGIIESGEIKKEKELLAILKNNLIDSEGRRVRDRFVVASLPEEKSFVRILQLPKMQKEEISAALRWELEANIPLPLDQVYYDYEVMEFPGGSATDHLDVAVAVFPRVIVDSYASVLKLAGLRPLALELESQAISRALVTDDRAHSSVIVVDIGLNRTSFVIFADGVIALTLTIDVGGKDFDAVIAKSLNISHEDADKVKKEFGLDRKYRNGEIVDSLIPLLSALVDELKKQIWYFRDHAEHRHGVVATDIEAIYMVGGDANLIGLDKYLAVSIKKPVYVGDPFVRLYESEGNRIPPIPHNASLKYATTVGLALRSDMLTGK